MNYYQNKPNQTQLVVSKVEPPVLSLPALSLVEVSKESVVNFDSNRL